MKYFLKTANLKPEVVLRQHQQNAVERINKKDGSLLLSHATGSGKTVTAIAAFEKLKQEGKASKALIVTPASLRENFAEAGVKKFTTDKYVIFGNQQENQGKDGRYVDPDTYAEKDIPYHIVSYDMYKKDPAKYIRAAGADTVIYDEIHRAKNEATNVTKTIKEARPLHRNFIGLTGSIVSNSPADIVPLIDAMTQGKHKLGSKALFESRFLEIDKNGKKIIKNKGMVRAQTAPYIDHVEVEDLKLSPPPKKVVETIKVPMSKHQEDLYRYMIDQLDPITKAKIRYGIGKKLNQREINNVFSQLMATRQLSNYVKAANPDITEEESLVDSPKMQRALEEVEKHIKQTPDAKVIVGTQFINSGVKPLQYHLKQRGYDPAVFIGKGNQGITEAKRQQEIEEFKTGKKNILLISGAGGEGLDLPDTTKIIMLDGHYNPEVIQQMEARGIRAGGQSGRPEKERKVEVTRLLTTPTIRKSDVAVGIIDAISPNTYVRRAIEGQPIFQNPIKRPFGVDELMTDVAKMKAEANADLKSLYKRSELNRTMRKQLKGKLVDTQAISREYMKAFGKYLEEDMVEDYGWIDKEKEKVYINTVRNTAETLGSKNPGINIANLRTSGYKSQDFDPETQKIKSGPVLKKALTVSAGSSILAPIFAIKGYDMAKGWGAGAKGQIAGAVGGALFLPVVGGVSKYLSDKKGKAYLTTPLAKLRKFKNLSDEEIRDLLRGAVIKKEEIKTTEHYL